MSNNIRTHISTNKSCMYLVFCLFLGLYGHISTSSDDHEHILCDLTYCGGTSDDFQYKRAVVKLDWTSFNIKGGVLNIQSKQQVESQNGEQRQTFYKIYQICYCICEHNEGLDIISPHKVKRRLICLMFWSIQICKLNQ